MAAGLSAGCGSGSGQGGAAAPAPQVSVAQVLSRPVQQWDEFNGRIGAVDTVALRPRVSGYVERVAYHEGDRVKKGQLLFAIDDRHYRAVLLRAQSDLERARSEAGLAASQARRAQVLMDAKAISREEFDAHIAAAEKSNAAVRAAEASVYAARLDLAFTEVRSPIDGRAGRALVTAGNLAEADTTQLTTVVSQDPVYVYFETDEHSFLRYGAWARSGQRNASGNAVRVGLADEPGYPHVGTVDFIDNRLDPDTGTIRARAVLPNPDGVFTPGLFARVQLSGRAEAAAVLIDEKAVLTDQDRKYVYVLAEDNTAVRKDVVLGRTVGGLRIVESGLAAKDKVVVNGVQKIFVSGMPVVPKPVTMVPAQSESQTAAR